MENKNTNTDYHKFVRVGNQKWEIVEITIKIIFFFAWDLYSLFFIQEIFKSHLKKNHPHLKCQFPPKIPIWPKTSHINVLKNGSGAPLPDPPHQPRGGGANYEFSEMCFVFHAWEFGDLMTFKYLKS